MAIDNTLNVEVTASVEGLKKGLAQAESNLKGFSNEAQKTTAKTNALGKTVKSNAVPALTSFSQVIQDAPYGIRGVANNITQLTSQFGYLSKSSGGAGNAFKAMVSSLTGPAGILLAVSLVTSLLVSYGDKLANIGSESGKVAEKQKKLVEVIGSLSSVLSAQVSALDSQLKLLELQKLPTTELKAEKLKILKTALQTTVNERAALYLQIEALTVAGKELSLKQKFYNLAAKLRGLPITEVAGLDNDEIIKLNELKKGLFSLDKTIADTVLKIGEIEMPSVFNPEKVKNNVKEVKRAIVEPLTTLFSQDIPQLQEASLSGMGVDFWARVLRYEELQAEKEKITQALQSFNAEAEQLIQGSITDTFANLGQSIGQAIAEGTNVFQAAGRAILTGIGNFLGDLGKMMIKYGVAALAYSTASKALLNPATAAPAAIGLIAAGTLLSVIGGAIGGFASSGGSSGSSIGTSTGGDYSSRNYGSSSSYSSGGGGTYVFEIAGTKLIGVLKNTLDRNKSLGGTNISFG